MCPVLPFVHVAKLFNLPSELISLSENGVGTADDPVYLTAHRGVWAVAPQNSLPSYEKAVELGYYTAECDIHLTKDNEWVLIHNSEAESQFCQFGEISDYTLEEVKTFSYKGGKNFWKYEDLRIATLDEYLDVFVGTQTRPQIEIKSDTYDMLYTVVDAVVEKGLEEQAIVISFDLEQLRVIHELNSNIELWYLIDEITPENIAAAKAVDENIWLSPNFEANDMASIQLAVDANIGVSFWTVNTVEDARMLYDMGIRYIETDILCN
jgi:glycerophosphoryl diester phosphodiesterase